MQTQILQLFPVTSTTLQTILSLAFYAFFFLYLFFGNYIQTQRILMSLSGALNKVKNANDKSKKELLDYLQKNGYKGDPSKQVDDLLEFFTIAPVSIDPAGLVRKIEHLLSVRDERVREEVKRLLPNKDVITTSVVENLLDTSSALNYYYKVLRHYYLLGKKTSNIYLLMQLQMILPEVLKEIEALLASIEPVSNVQPLGDGIGAMVAAKLMLNNEKKTIARDTVFAEVSYKNRDIYAMKAEGPAGNVGAVGNAVERLINDYGLKPSLIVMIDAALKLEGEPSGEISEGVGAAIGGIGVDKFKIEEVSSKTGTPLYAIIIKETLAEAITAMTKDIIDAAAKVQARLDNLLEDRTKEGDTVIIVGVGNTLGVGQ
ncbi:MAG: DUF1512 domain-containing protein [Nitrososphaeria archaeon]